MVFYHLRILSLGHCSSYDEDYLRDRMREILVILALGSFFVTRKLPPKAKTMSQRRAKLAREVTLHICPQSPN